MCVCVEGKGRREGIPWECAVFLGSCIEFGISDIKIENLLRLKQNYKLQNDICTKIMRNYPERSVSHSKLASLVQNQPRLKYARPVVAFPCAWEEGEMEMFHSPVNGHRLLCMASLPMSSFQHCKTVFMKVHDHHEVEHSWGQQHTSRLLPSMLLDSLR